MKEIQREINPYDKKEIIIYVKKCDNFKEVEHKEKLRK